MSKKQSFLAMLSLFCISNLRRRGAYCAAVIVSLLNLPLSLTPESPAWTPDHPTLYTKLADYVQKCSVPPPPLPPPKSLPVHCHVSVIKKTPGTTSLANSIPCQVKPTRAVYRLTQTRRHMVHMRSAP